MSMINVTNLTFSYEGSYDNIFENVSFQIDTDWKLGFIGRNGRGKTTFLNLLRGKYEFSGIISAKADFEYFPFEVKDETVNTIEVIEGISQDFQQWEIECELSQLEVSTDVLYRAFNTLSNGEQTKVLLAALFLKENRFLLIDEPTNHLDSHARQVVSDYLNTKKSFILVSHDRAFLDNCIDHVLSINKGNIEIQKGNFSSWWENKQRQDNFELAENDKLKKDIKRLSDAARRTSVWSEKVEKTKFGTKNSGIKPDKGYIGHKSAKMMKRSVSIANRREKALGEKSKLLKNIENAEELKISGMTYHSSTLVSLKNVSLFYGEKEVFNNLCLQIDQGDRLALCGKNGSGKSSLIKLICGGEIGFTGDVFIGNNLVISHVSQETSFLNGNLADFSRENNIDESLFKAILRKLDFSRLQFEKDIKDFSQGQKKKVLIAKSLCEKAHLYIWDEPLNYIDVISRIQIEELLLEYKPTLLFVEHDNAFSESIATKRVCLC